MVYQSSYGIIPLKFKDGAWQVLLIQHYAGHWGFPKGRAEEGEDPQQSAIRELQEETGLTVLNFLSEHTIKESYQFYSKNKKIEKTVTYFIAEVSGTLKLQREEVKAAKWIPLTDACDSLTFPASKASCLAAQQLLQQ